MPIRVGPPLATLRVRSSNDLGGPAANGDFAEMPLLGRSYIQAAAELQAECRRHDVDYFDGLGNYVTRSGPPSRCVLSSAFGLQVLAGRAQGSDKSGAARNPCSVTKAASHEGR
jgi:hypothetical protein